MTPLRNIGIQPILFLTKALKLYTLSILLLGCVGCIHSPPLRTFSARRGIRSFAALPKSKMVRVYTLLRLATFTIKNASALHY